MRLQKAEEIIRGLQAPQQRRILMYHGNLSKDKDPKHFDARMYECLLKYSRDEAFVKRTKNYLDSIAWNQSKYSFKQIEQQLERFALPNAPYFGWNTHFKAAKESLVREFESFNLKSLQYFGNDNIEEYLPREDTHAGWSYIMTGDKEKGKYREGLFQTYVSEMELAKQNGSFNKPILIGTRTQASNPFGEDGSYKNDFKYKSRLVSMVDINVIMAEMVTAKRLQARLSNYDWYAGGKDDRVIGGLLQNWRGDFRHWISIDYSSYDQSISDWLIREAFDVVRAAYRYDDAFDEELFKIVREDFIKKVFVVGMDNLVYSEKGVPSGSMFTQLIDSIVNRLMIDCYMHSVGISNYRMMIMGDDNIIFTNDEVNLEHLSTYLDHNFRVEMNPSKCGFGLSSKQDPEFLSRKWTFRGVYRLPELLIAKLIFPERYRDYFNNPSMQPELIIECFTLSFPLGMDFLDTTSFDTSLSEMKRRLGKGRWLTGLMRYRLLYAS